MASHQPEAPTERRSETERHWDIVCLTLVTLATAVLGAFVIFSDISKIGQDAAPITYLDILVSVSALLATGVYIILAIEATRAIFPPPQHRGVGGLAWKRSQVMSTVGLFLTLILLFGLTMLARTAVSVYYPWVVQ